LDEGSHGRWPTSVPGLPSGRRIPIRQGQPATRWTDWAW